MFSFYNKRWIFIGISTLIILTGLVFYFANGGFNVGIEFAGGTSILFDTGSESTTKDDLFNAVKESLDIEAETVQVSLANPAEFTIKMVTLTPEQSQKLVTDLKAKFNIAEDQDNLSIESFSAAYGIQLATDAWQSALIALILIMIYVSFRFEFLSGVGATAALVHDVLIMLSVYAIFRVPVNSSFVAAILTILGYSINDTVVIFDRIRDNLKIARKETFSQTMDKSINETLTRSINTSLTTFITITLLYIMGVQSIKEFSFPIMIGLVAGTYSSIAIASPIWGMLKTAGIEARKKQVKAR